MKILLFCLLSVTIFGQTKLSDSQKKAKAEKKYIARYNEGVYNVYKIDSVPVKGILINKGWKFQLADGANWAKPDFNDNKWDTISINKPFKDFHLLEKNKIGWFRKKIFIDSTLINKPYIFKILIAGAAEIYLNGELLHKIGKVNIDPKKASTPLYQISLPYIVTFKSAGEQVLAIKFLFTPYNKLNDQFNLYPISLRLQKLDGLVEKHLAETNSESFIYGLCSGLFFMMAFIHFFFYYFFRSQRFNIFFSISMLLFGIFCNSIPSVGIYQNINSFINLKVISKLLFLIAHIILLTAIYEYLQYQKRLLYGAVISVFILASGLGFFKIINDLYLFLLYLLLIINYIFLIWWSIKNKNQSGKVMREAMLIYVATFFIFLVFFILWANVINPNNFPEAQTFLTVFLPFAVTLVIVGPQLSVSGAISFSLAKEFVKTNTTLTQKLSEIEILSQEKQQILTSQNEQLEKQVKERTAELKTSLENLKSTQVQLIQSEKLASLGELTAGIAHEIQNPLNFVTNFSELSIELIQELIEEENKPSTAQDAGLKVELLNDISQNQEKINHHGKRASDIVKGMLEHSRTSSGERQLTDINGLVEEYLRLSYHGLRAKDKSFNSDFKTDLDKNLPKINIATQDISRVLLNLLNNAFYAVKRTTNPLVTVSTAHNNNQIIIIVKDNGTGIPNNIKSKIFQPFFTTKPTGEGTGLGLSLSYDIITKGHGGTLEVTSKEGEGTEFIVKLPL